MPPRKLKVRFEPNGVEVEVRKGKNLMEAAIDAEVRIAASCGGAGTCGTCKVNIVQGEVESTRTEWITPAEYKSGTRQACQSAVLTDLVVDIPIESRLETAVMALETEKGLKPAEDIATGWCFHPPIQKHFIELTPPTIEDNKCDLARLLKGLAQHAGLEKLNVDFGVVRKLADVLREENWKVTATTITPGPNASDMPLLLADIEPGDTRDQLYSLAFDIGTTGVKGQLLDLANGKVLAEALDYNGQISYGEDVISRISYCLKAGGLKKLQRAIMGTVNEITSRMLSECKLKGEDIAFVVIAGNSTMTQLFFGLEPKYLRLAPYTPTICTAPLARASSLGMDMAEHVRVYAIPAVASYVGGDIVSGVVGAGIHQRKKLTLFIDIGTNGEIVIGNSDWMVTAACSAGPAFEGGGIKHGMIASEGAIEDFSIDPDTLKPTIKTIGGGRPKGICGSGLINIIAELLTAAVLGQNGKFHTHLSTDRVRKGPDGYEYILAYGGETKTKKDIVITEVDIDNLIRAKAALYAGYKTLIESVGMGCADLEEVIIAGAFGSHIDIEHSITIGLLPDIPRERFFFIGNGSILGARLTSFSTDILDDGAAVANMMTNVELSVDPKFMNHYTASMFLPHPNEEEFPSVYKRLGRHKNNRKEY